jgi:hypothetical protein
MFFTKASCKSLYTYWEAICSSNACVEQLMLLSYPIGFRKAMEQFSKSKSVKIIILFARSNINICMNFSMTNDLQNSFKTISAHK